MKRTFCILLTILMLMPMFAYAKTNTEIPFEDIDISSWYYSAVRYDYLNGLMLGVSGTQFAPDTTVTREMLVCALANVYGIDEEIYDVPSGFIDVERGRWYSAPIEWARQNGIIAGYNESVFGLGDSLTRAQMAQILMRYAEYRGKGTDIHADLSYYVDAADIATWADDAMEYVVASGFMVGTTDITLSPNDLTRRCELALVLYKFVYKIKTGNDIPETADADALTIAESNEPRIICWGDSLTKGIGATTPYPQVIEELSGVTTINYGVSSEIDELIAMRQGAVPVYATPMTIPADTTAVSIDIVDDNGDTSYLGYYGMSGINMITVAGVEGYLRRSGGGFYFTRAKAGEPVTITKNTRVITYGMAQRQTGDILVLFVGSNNKYGASGVVDLIDIIHKMIAYSGTDKYIVVSLTAKCMMADLDQINAALAQEFGDKYLDVRTYLLTRALSDYEISPSVQDLQDISIGEVPASLRYDSCHGNQIYYDIVAKMIVEKVNKLGYLE